MEVSKKFISTLLAAALTVCSVVAGIASLPRLPAYAVTADGSKNIYTETNPTTGETYFVYESNNKKITSSTGYRTIGLNIFVGKDSPDGSNDGVLKNTSYDPVAVPMPRDGAGADPSDPFTYESYEDGHGRVTTIRRVKLSDIVSYARLQGNEAAAQVFESGAFSMVVDGIMTTFTMVNGVPKLDATMDPTGTGQIFLLNGQPFYYNEVGIQQAKAWMGVTGLNTNFNKVWKQGLAGAASGDSSTVNQGAVSPSGSTTPTMTVRYNAVQSSGKLLPDYYTYHNSGTFDVGEGIPSGESMTVGFYADDWYGLYSYQQRRVEYSNLPVVFKLSGTYTVHNWYYDNYDDELGWYNYRDHPYQQATERTITVPVERAGEYWAIIAVKFYKLANTTTENESYTSHKFSYSSGASATAKINGQEPTSENDYEPQDEYHVALDSLSIPTHSVAATGIDRPLSDYSEDYLINTYGLKEQTKSDYGITVKNDALTINGSVGSIVCLEEEERHNDKSSYASAARSPKCTSEPQKIDKSIAHWASGDATVTIPQDKSNGKYDTTLNVTYTRFMPKDGVEEARSKTGTNAIWEGYTENEPVVVHTPVYDYIKNVSNKDGPKTANEVTKTQLIETPATEYGTVDGVEPQTLNHLLLDGTYSMKFDTHKWLSEQTRGDMSSPTEDRTGNGDPGYNLPGIDGETDLLEKYTQVRKVRFPFDVMIIGNSGTKTYYPVDGDYTEWIKLEQTSDTVKFYIPTWAKESTTKFGNGTSRGCYAIQFRVEAYNTGGNTEKLEHLMNSQLANYVATFNVPCNLSGIIYGFQIVGCNDKDMYGGYTNETTASNDIAFALLKEEKKAGTKNRLGSDSVRYTVDGTINSAWEKINTIPTRPGTTADNPGTSWVYSGMGAFWKGTTFSYSVKTIANLGDSDQDSVSITPSFRYYDKDGNETSAVKIYYTDNSGNFIEVGSEKDKANRKTWTLGSPQFKGAWYEGTKFVSADKQAALGYTLPDDLQYTVEHSSASSKEQFSGRKINGYSMSDILLNSKARLYTGSDEELEANLDYERGDSRFWKIESIAGVDEDQFRQSMQTWYGQYTIPEHLYVCYNGIDIDGDGVVSVLGSKEGDENYHTGDDLNGDGVVDLTDFGLTGKLSRSSSIWLKTGYLMLNFDIKTKNNGVDHLTYSGGENSMWITEGRVKTITLYTQTGVKQEATAENPTGNTKNIPFEITTKPGDICLIDLRYGLTDKYSAHIFMSN